MATFIDGVGASENIDSSGERILIAGLDDSSLALDGVFNWEHHKDIPAQIVGKVLKSKKIFSEKDCEDDRQLYYWNKVQCPFLYVMGELMDDYKESAKEVAGMFRYDADKKDQNERSVMNFSIEGANIEKQGMVITRSIARKVTITVLPCNKAAVAEMVPSAETNKDDLSSIFKTEPQIEIEILTSPNLALMAPKPVDINKSAELLGLEPMKKNVLPFKKPLTSAPGVPTKPAAAPAPGAPAQATIPSQTNNPGGRLGSTKTGKTVFSHAKIHEYHGFGSADHHEAAMMHHNAAQAATTPKMGAHHLDKMKLHLGAARTAEHKEGRFARGKIASAATHEARRMFGKSLEAGMGNAAPGQLTQGAALQKEDLSKQLVKQKLPKRIMKSEWIARADEEYARWEKRDEFRAFMAVKMPKLTKGEIDAIGKTIALKKSIDAESELSKLINSHDNSGKKSEK